MNNEIEVKIRLEPNDFLNLQDSLDNKDMISDGSLLSSPPDDSILERMNNKSDFRSEQQIKDTYYNDKNNNFSTNGRTLRIRETYERDRYKFETECFQITFKTDATIDNGIKCRKEFETEIENPKIIKTILLATGLQDFSIVEKVRLNYDFYLTLQSIQHRVRVSLDSVYSLGNYVEIEGTDKQVIEEAIKQLRIVGTKEEKSYCQLIKENTK